METKEELNVDRFKNFLLSQKMRLTSGRKAILLELFKKKKSKHLDADEIYTSLKKKKKRVSRATVYRTLNLLKKSGIVSSLLLGEDHSHFEPHSVKDIHIHFICNVCKKIIEFESGEAKKLIEKIASKESFEAETFEIQVSGICSDCKMKLLH
ncbi:MAG: transcriptional repressor [Acidobacteriota bacterium]